MPAEFHPVTPERWPDLVRLFEERGPRGGFQYPASCWCLYWRMPRSQLGPMSRSQKREGMHRLVRSGAVPGILAYRDGRPIAWCSVGPREQYPALERSAVLRRIDDAPVWSIVCFYVSRAERGRGLTLQLIEAAVNYARTQGARIVEAYPAVPQPGAAGVMTFMGLPGIFRRAGFVEVAAPSRFRKIMRRTLRSGRHSRCGASSG